MRKIYDFPYHALVEIKFAHNQGTMHIPLPFFSDNQNRIDFVFDLPVSEKIRDNEFFRCPVCGEHSFYAGICENCYEEIFNTSDKEIREVLHNKHNHEALKLHTKNEFLRRLDAGIPSLGIISACLIFADRDNNDHWYLPYPAVNTKLSEINSDIYKIIDKWIDDGKIEPFIRLDSERKIIHIPHIDFEDPIQDFIDELEEELGYRVDVYKLPFKFGDKNIYETCHRCGKITREVKLINSHYLCKDCCKEDPIMTIDATIVINYDLTGYIYSDYLDPDTVNKFTEFKEIPFKYFNAFKYCRKIIICDIKQNKYRYFIEVSKNIKLLKQLKTLSEMQVRTICNFCTDENPYLLPQHCKECVWYSEINEIVSASYPHAVYDEFPDYMINQINDQNEIEEYDFEIIEVEGSDELRRQVNGVWQHQHEGYDYWHPMARIHKEARNVV